MTDYVALGEAITKEMQKEMRRAALRGHIPRRHHVDLLALSWVLSFCDMTVAIVFRVRGHVVMKWYLFVNRPLFVDMSMMNLACAWPVLEILEHCAHGRLVVDAFYRRMESLAQSDYDQYKVWMDSMAEGGVTPLYRYPDPSKDPDEGLSECVQAMLQDAFMNSLHSFVEGACHG